MTEEIRATCSKCGTSLQGAPKKTFLGFQELSCESCKHTERLPLTKGYRTTYWVITVVMILSIAASFQQGSVGLPGLLGILVVIALVMDARLRKKLTAS